MLYPTELRYILMRYAAPSVATLHLTNLSCPLPRYPGPSELGCTLLSYAALYCARMHANALFCPLLSNYAPFWATKHPSKLLCSLGATEHPTKLCCTLLNSLRYAAPYMGYLPSFNFLEYRQKKLIYSISFNGVKIENPLTLRKFIYIPDMKLYLKQFYLCCFSYFRGGDRISAQILNETDNIKTQKCSIIMIPSYRLFNALISFGNME